MKKITNLLFTVVFVLCLVLPALTMEFGRNIKSETDNEYLPELNITDIRTASEQLAGYVDKRIGFRQQALDAYQIINDRVFSIMEHPIYMYGENDHVYFKGSSYVQNYQHLNLNQDYAEKFAEGLLGFQAYMESRGGEFLYFYIPDKESVYPEYYPKSVNVYGEVSRSDQIISALDTKGVSYYFSKEAMLEGKKTLLVNNIKYDAGHWNHNGAFVSIQGLYSLLRQTNPHIRPLVLEDFTVENKLMESLQVSHFEINEEVPFYSLKKSSAIDNTAEFFSQIELSFPEQYVCHYVNPDCEDLPKLLIFGDSYLAGYDQFFMNHFHEYTYIHRYNVYNQEFFEYYVEQVNPDIVIYENPERSHMIDLFQSQTLE